MEQRNTIAEPIPRPARNSPVRMLLAREQLIYLVAGVAER
jgi:hypothetical protein